MCSFDGGDRTDHHMILGTSQKRPEARITTIDDRKRIMQLVLKSKVMRIAESEKTFQIHIDKDESNRDLWSQKERSD